jgi:hypothetical protein
MSESLKQKVRIQLATTFSLEEVQVALFMMKTIQRGGDPKAAMQHPAWASLAKKFQKMERKAKGKKGSQPPPPPTRGGDEQIDKYVQQGYTEKEARGIVEQLKKK